MTSRHQDVLKAWKHDVKTSKAPDQPITFALLVYIRTISIMSNSIQLITKALWNSYNYALTNNIIYLHKYPATYREKTDYPNGVNNDGVYSVSPSDFFTKFS